MKKNSPCSCLTVFTSRVVGERTVSIVLSVSVSASKFVFKKCNVI